MPTTPSCQPSPMATMAFASRISGRGRLDLGDCLRGDRLLDLPSFGVEFPELVGDDPRAVEIVFQQQGQCVLGMAQPPGGVDHRGEAVAQRAGVQRSGVDARRVA